MGGIVGKSGVSPGKGAEGEAKVLFWNDETAQWWCQVETLHLEVRRISI